MSNYDTLTYFSTCSKCGRRILIQILSFGISHNADVVTTCAECLKREGIDAAYTKDHPEDAKRIQEWIDEEVKKEDAR